MNHFFFSARFWDGIEEGARFSFFFFFQLKYKPWPIYEYNNVTIICAVVVSVSLGVRAMSVNCREGKKKHGPPTNPQVQWPDRQQISQRREYRNKRWHPFFFLFPLILLLSHSLRIQLLVKWATNKRQKLGFFFPPVESGTPLFFKIWNTNT